MKRSLHAVKGYYRHMPERKHDPAFIGKTVELFVDLRTADMPDELEAALREALAVGDGFELHGGLSP